MKFKKLTALEVLAERSSMATDRAFEARNNLKEKNTLGAAESKGYNEGKAAAYADAHRIMQAELARLKNLFQNGALNIDSFGV
ncbi:hypothetical protein [Rhizobium phage RHph_X2_26]|nr:hypothetical protein [Rhizobium phage RHph_X2_26]